MPTSGTWDFDLDLPEIIEEAYERVGVLQLSAYHYRTARRSLDMLMLEWQNEGTHLWSVESASIPLTSGVAAYDLSPEQLDVIEAAIRSGEGTPSQTDINLNRISVTEFSGQTNKLTTGRPVQYYLQRKPTGVTLNLWPVPDDSTYRLYFWYMKRIEDTGADGTNTMAVPIRFLPALTSGLAYQLALKTPAALDRAPGLLAEYDRQYELAAEAHREKAPVKLVPRVR